MLSTPSSPHLQPKAKVRKVMAGVIMALIPGMFAQLWFFGAGVLVNISVALVSAVVFETLMLLATGKSPLKFLLDGSAIVTALLLALCLPPTAPWWLTVVGTGFAMIFGKHLYGGLGNNPFNPAMIGFVVLFISFPTEMTQWTAPVGVESSIETKVGTTEVVTQATPLDTMGSEARLGKSIDEIREGAVFSSLSGVGWQWIALAYLLGGIFMLARGIIRWQIPVSMLLAFTAVSTIFWLVDSAAYADPIFHLLSGATMIGAFFIATDPVSASTTPRGRLIYGAGIGILAYIIRVFATHPDGIAFAVLLMNICAPLIDAYTQPRVFGRNKKRIDGGDQ